MPIKIYWGPPGSYKSASAVSDEVARCAKEGRVLITNMRGLSADRVRKNAPEVKEGFDVIHLRSDKPGDLDKMRKWWHWAPFGAYIIFDEIQAIYPPDWSATKLHELDMKEERFFPDREAEDGEVIREAMPTFVGLIFDMHRHGNWDMCFTTPNIKKVRTEIRAVAEWAYKHKNLGPLGLGGRYLQFTHLAEDNGNPSDIYVTRWRRAPKWAFNVYDSTATGKHSDSQAGISILANPKLLLMLCVLAIALGIVFYLGKPEFMRDDHSKKATGAPVPAAPANPAVDPGPPAQGLRTAATLTSSAPSNAWRLVGVIETPKRRQFFLASGRAFKPAHGPNCFRAEYGWACRVEDGIANAWTGPEPIVDVPKIENPIATALQAAPST